MKIEKAIPEEHQLICKGCGKLLDMRDINVLSHGWIENDKIICYDEINISYSSSIKKGDSVLYTKNKTPINLN